MSEIPEKFYDLVLRYFDGDLEPAALDELNGLLRSDGRLRDAFAALCVRSRMVREIGEPERQAEIRTADGSAGVISQLKLARDTAGEQQRSGSAPWGRVFAAAAALALVSRVLFWGIGRQGAERPRVRQPFGRHHPRRQSPPRLWDREGEGVRRPHHVG